MPLDDSNLKLHELVDRQGRLAAKGKPAHFVVGSAFKASMITGGAPERKDMPMITLKYRSMRNRNVVVRTTVFSFNDEGIAKVVDSGNAALDAAALVGQSGGMATMVREQPPQESSQPPQESPKPQSDSKPAQDEAQEASGPEIDVVEESVEGESASETSQPPSRPGKKGPPKRPPGRTK